jgi:4-alpha-glucanotransferase
MTRPLPLANRLNAGSRSGSRRAGILVPLFSIPSTTSWGIGEIGDIEPMTRWLDRAGQCILQLLPINEMPPGERSPYSALSAMAIDPQFISMRALEDFAAIGGEAALDSESRATIDSARVAPAIDYAAVRRVKLGVLQRSFAHFRDIEWAGETRRAAAFQAFCAEQSWWLDDYALFRALHAHHGERPWMEWPAPVRDREPDALAGARAALADDVLFRQWLQWVADDQWRTARGRAGHVALFGDLPFMVAGDSADVWARQDEFRLDVSVGVPPDAFSEDGQDWGLPAYRWDIFAGRDFDWLRRRARRNADLFDGYRVDHLVGFYRTYFRERNGDAGFTPPDEASQEMLGERVLNVFLTSGADIVAEDLGVVPDFVRASLDRLGVPGYRVLRWERLWSKPGQPFRDPAQYPSTSVATSGTHDTEPMAIWWAQASVEERTAVLEIPAVRERISTDERAAVLERSELSNRLREALLESLYRSGSDLLILPVQDVFGWRDRINRPATVGEENWTWRLPWPSDHLSTEPQAIAAADQLREWSNRSGRCG